MAACRESDEMAPESPDIHRIGFDAQLSVVLDAQKSGHPPVEQVGPVYSGQIFQLPAPDGRDGGRGQILVGRMVGRHHDGVRFTASESGTAAAASCGAYIGDRLARSRLTHVKSLSRDTLIRKVFGLIFGFSLVRAAVCSIRSEPFTKFVNSIVRKGYFFFKN